MQIYSIQTGVANIAKTKKYHGDCFNSEVYQVKKHMVFIFVARPLFF